jgi:hypothetical protein
LEDELRSDIPAKSQSTGDESCEEEPPVDREHNLEIEEFHFKLESCSEEEREA